MNHNPYGDISHSHINAGQGHPPSTGPPPSMAPYPQYSQPSVLQPGPQTYPPAQPGYGQYPYSHHSVGQPQSAGHPVSSSMGGGIVQQPLSLPAMAPTAPGPVPGSQGYQPHTFDTTGQIAPPGMKPRVTATLWEDEGSLCFQVEAKGVCVARREDNHMINGTKLLNVAGMTRGRRDGILKSEKMRHVVKIGPMHLKGVWIPFDRALDFANKEKITELLYPLFVHDIGALLYHPSNQTRAGSTAHAAVAAAERRRADQQQRLITGPQHSQAPPLHHHHSMSNATGSHIQQPASLIAPHPGSARPALDRAHTFPTPPASASSIMGMSNSGGSYEWGPSSVSTVPGNQPLAIDTGLSNARSVPTTPATTPPGSNMQSMQHYQTSQAYDGSRPVYTAPPHQQGQYSSHQTLARYGQPLQPSPYIKNEMAPPTRAGHEGEHQPDSKLPEGLLHQGTEAVGHGPGEEEAEHDHDAEYAHNGGSYSGGRHPYGYNPSPSAPLHSDHSHLPSEIGGSPHQNGSDRATPRTAATTTTTSQSQWSGSYSNSQRSQHPPSSNLYNVMSDTRGSAANGNSAADSYSGSAVMPTSYSSQPYPTTNGSATSNKRAREDDDNADSYGRPSSRGAAGDDVEGLKRRKTMGDPGVGGAVGGTPFDRDGSRGLNRTRSAITQRRR